MLLNIATQCDRESERADLSIALRCVCLVEWNVQGCRLRVSAADEEEGGATATGAAGGGGGGGAGERHQAKRREQRRRDREKAAAQSQDPLESLRDRIDECIGCGDLDLVRSNDSAQAS